MPAVVQVVAAGGKADMIGNNSAVAENPPDEPLQGFDMQHHQPCASCMWRNGDVCGLGRDPSGFGLTIESRHGQVTREYTCDAYTDDAETIETKAEAFVKRLLAVCEPESRVVLIYADADLYVGKGGDHCAADVERAVVAAAIATGEKGA